jgi:hypothetical protein
LEGKRKVGGWRIKGWRMKNGKLEDEKRKIVENTMGKLNVRKGLRWI